jgi:hypothetical protein
MKTKMCLMTGLALLSIALAAQEPQWTAKLSVSAAQVIVGEPAFLRLAIENKSGVPLTLPMPLEWWHPRYISIRFLERPPLETSEDYGNPITAIQEAPVSYSKKTYAPGEVIVLERPVYNGNPGRCAVKYTYDSRQVPESFNMKTRQIENNADVWRGLIESNEISWQVVEPAGVDLEAMKAYQTTIPHAIRGLIIQQWKDELLARFPTSTYAGYVIAKKLLDLSDWRFKVGTPASAIQAGKEHPEWATRSQSDVELFNLVEKHIQGGNVPESLRAVLYCYYGEQLILRGRAAEAEAAFCRAVKEKPADAKGEAYFTRAQQFLDALNKHGA